VATRILGKNDQDHADANHQNSFPPDDSMIEVEGGAAPWDTKKYLNIWVCNLVMTPRYPSSPRAQARRSSPSPASVPAAPPFNKGRTTTHEIGHFLNLRHIWGDTEDCTGTDLAGDTPNAAGPNYGKPGFPSISCGNAPNGDMFMNYMDYTDDAAISCS
jgi:hypothetical protein